jgi:hypothetical protein
MHGDYVSCNRETVVYQGHNPLSEVFLGNDRPFGAHGRSFDVTSR